MAASNSLPNVITVNHKKGDTLKRIVEIRVNGVATDISTGWDFQFQIRDKRGVTPLTTALISSGITLLPDIGQMEIEIADTVFETGAFSACDCKCQYTYEFEATNPDSEVFTPFGGPFVLFPFAGYNSGGSGNTTITVDFTTDTIVVNILQGVEIIDWLNSLEPFDSDDDAINIGGLSVGDYYKTSSTHVDSAGGLPKQIL